MGCFDFFNKHVCSSGSSQSLVFMCSAVSSCCLQAVTLSLFNTVVFFQMTVWMIVTAVIMVNVSTSSPLTILPVNASVILAILEEIAPDVSAHDPC